MQNAKCKIEVSASRMIKIVPQAHRNFEFLILNFEFPFCGMGIKNSHP